MMQACIPSTSRSASLAWQPILRRALSSSRRIQASAGNSTLAAKEGPEDWLRKQMRLAERMENRKTKVNVKQDQDIAFARYVPPPKSGYRPWNGFERWATYLYCRLLNWYQNRMAGKAEFGHWLLPRVMQSRYKNTVKQDIIPLYKQLCEAQATGELASLDGRIAQSVYATMEDSAIQAQRQGERRSWRLHKMNGVTVPTIRLNEMKKGEEVLQLVARFESEQSLEIRDAAGRLKPGSGRHEAPQKIIENWVFQKRTYMKDAKWTAIKSVPTLTPGQAFGFPEREIRALAGKQKRPSVLTVV